jgi:Flp pilus assembly protein TadD
VTPPCLPAARRACRALALAVLAALLAACATPPPPAPVTADPLLRDELFAAPTVRPDAAEIFALSEPMRRYLRQEIASQARLQGPQAGLLAALYERGQLKLDYDATVTRNAAQAFEARAGNCLSLVVMTAAFARELGLAVRYQTAYLEETWTRSGATLVRAGHVNITLGPVMNDRANPLSRALTIDFLPPEQARQLRTREVSEATIVAMFMNNRAVEALLRGAIDDAYAWTRASLAAGADFPSAYNTLGILYARRGYLRFAEAAFERVLQKEPDNTRALANLAEVYARTDRLERAQPLYVRLAQLEPQPPFHFYEQGMAALARGDARAARALFARELARGTVSTEVVYALAVAHARLGDTAQAEKHFRLAADAAARGERAGASEKLAQLKSRVNGASSSVSQ